MDINSTSAPSAAQAFDPATWLEGFGQHGRGFLTKSAGKAFPCQADPDHSPGDNVVSKAMACQSTAEQHKSARQECPKGITRPNCFSFIAPSSITADLSTAPPRQASSAKNRAISGLRYRKLDVFTPAPDEISIVKGDTLIEAR